MIVAEGATAACVLVRSVAAWALGAAALLLVAFSSVLYRAVGSGRARHCHCFDAASTAHPRAHIACNLGLAVAALAAAAAGWAPVASHPGRSVFGAVLGLVVGVLFVHLESIAAVIERPHSWHHEKNKVKASSRG